MFPKPNQDGRCGDDVHGTLHDALPLLPNQVVWGSRGFGFEGSGYDE